MKLSAFLPMLLFAASGIYMSIVLPRWYDARYVRHPERIFWGFWHIFDDEEWTEEGLVLRGRYARGILFAVAMAFVGIVIGRILADLGM